MDRILYTARLALPALFFGYAVFANLSLLAGPRPAVNLPDAGLLSGGLTRDLDATYKAGLPHVNPSFGLIGAARYAVLGEARTGALVGRDGWLFTSEETRPLPSDADLTAIIRLVAATGRHLRSNGIDLVVVPLPAKIDVLRAKSHHPAFGAAQGQLYTRFMAGLAGSGVAVVDARNALSSLPEQVFLATDTHWTPRGAERVAAAVAASGTIAAGGLVLDTIPSAPRTMTGDLVRFVTTDALAPHVGLPQEMITPVTLAERDEPADIFAGSQQDIVLVGTSYSANPDWGFADALMVALGRDMVNMAAPGIGPLQPMQDYLATALDRTAPPAVVIWEIPVRYLTDPALWQAMTPLAPEFVALTQKEQSGG